MFYSVCSTNAISDCGDIYASDVFLLYTRRKQQLSTVANVLKCVKEHEYEHTHALLHTLAMVIYKIPLISSPWQMLSICQEVISFSCIDVQKLKVFRPQRSFGSEVLST